MSETRSHSNVVEIDASPAAVWKAITDAEQLVGWFVTDARVDPREGGEFWVSWGEGMDAPGRIEVWDPERHLRVSEQPPPGVEIPEGVQPKMIDYHIESSGGRTVLRIVHSGFGAESSFDAEFDSTHRGWRSFMDNLRHYLERHGGGPNAHREIYATPSGTLEEIWADIVGPDLLGGVSGSVGDRYRTTAVTGEVLEGTILEWRPPHAFGASVDAWGDGILRIMAEGPGFLWAQFLAYGDATSDIDNIEKRWREVLEQRYGIWGGFGS